MLPGWAEELAVSREQGEEEEQLEPEPEGEAYRLQLTWGDEVAAVVEAVVLLAAVALPAFITWLKPMAMPKASRIARADTIRMVLFILVDPFVFDPCIPLWRPHKVTRAATGSYPYPYRSGVGYGLAGKRQVSV